VFDTLDLRRAVGGFPFERRCIRGRLFALAAISAARLMQDRADAMDYYLGDMRKDMPAQDGRSRAVSTDVADTIEGLMPLRADFQHLRRWRKSVEQAQSYTFKAVITVVVTGLVGAVWLGIKVMLGK
jgi:hypothetical protein